MGTLCPAAAALLGGTGLTAEQGVLNRAPGASITCRELWQARQAAWELSERSGASRVSQAAPGAAAVVWHCRSGAERGGVTDTRGLPGARAGAGIHWGSPAVPWFLGVLKPQPARRRLSLGERRRCGWQQDPEGFPWLWEPPGCWGEGDAMWALHLGNTRAIPNLPVVGFGCPDSLPLPSCWGRMCWPPIFPVKHQQQSCCLASASLPGAESKLQSPV